MIQNFENAGAFSIVLECIETKLSKRLQIIYNTNNWNRLICQLRWSNLVIDDLIGLSKSKFKFVKKYLDISRIIENAVKRYKSEVIKKDFH